MFGNMMNGFRRYATWNPNDKAANHNLSQGNLVCTNTGAGACRATIGKSTGKWYWEVVTDAVSGGSRGIGTSAASLANYPGIDAFGCEYDKNGKFYYNSITGVAYGTTFTTSVIGIALDLDAKTINFYKDGIAQGVRALGANLNSGVCFPMVGSGPSIHTYTANFGEKAFKFPVPSGFNPGVYE